MNKKGIRAPLPAPALCLGPVAVSAFVSEGGFVVKVGSPL